MPLPHLSSPSSSSSSSSSRARPNQTLTLIPGLPNDVASLLLSFVPYPHQSRIKSTCKSWYHFLSSSSKTLISLRSQHRHLSHLICIFPTDPSIEPPLLFDPQNLSWFSLPLMPYNPHAYGLCNFTAVALGPHIFILGGSLFDTRSYPLDRPIPSSAVFRYSFLNNCWEKLSPMLSPRGSFACIAIPDSDKIVVAGGGSRHTLFGAAGSRMTSVEMYDVGRDEWETLDGLPRFRAGCVGFLAENEEGEREFWVMGGYGEARTVSGVLPVDEYYRDAVVMGLSGGKWREIGDMWGEGERARRGKIVVVDGGRDLRNPGVFMLDGCDILRYDIATNCWQMESSVPRKAPYNKSFGFVALDGELHVMTILNGVHSTETRLTRQQNKAGVLFIQIYHPKKKTWRSLVSKPPLNHQLDFNTTVMCTICL